MTRTCFVASPINAEFTRVLDTLIRPPIEECGFEVIRADQIDSSRSIIQDFVEMLLNADLVIADLTGLNPNVMYELGLAHAFTRPTVIITQDLNSLPFDLKPYRVIDYSTEFHSAFELKERLQSIGKLAIENPSMFSNPVTDYALMSRSKLSSGRLFTTKRINRKPERPSTNEFELIKKLKSIFLEILEQISDFNDSIGEYTSETNRLIDENRSAAKDDPDIDRLHANIQEQINRLNEFQNKISITNQNTRTLSHDLYATATKFIQNSRRLQLIPHAKTEMVNVLSRVREASDGSISNLNSIWRTLTTTKTVSSTLNDHRLTLSQDVIEMTEVFSILNRYLQQIELNILNSNDNA